MKGLGRKHLMLALAVAAGIACLVWLRHEWVEKRVKVIEPGRLVRGAWQRPGPLRKLIERERIRTIVTLTAINASDPKFRGQARVVRDSGVRWLIIPMRGSRGTPEQMALAADLLADTARQPVFFHCVAGHHRTSLVHAAYLIRHQGYSADQAWQVVSSLPWARPDALVDRNDRFLIEEFARVQGSLTPARENGVWEMGNEMGAESTGQVDAEAGHGRADRRRRLGGLESGPSQLRGGPAGPSLPIGTDARDVPRPRDS